MGETSILNLQLLGMRDPNLVEDLRWLHAPEYGWVAGVALAVVLACVMVRWLRRRQRGLGRRGGLASDRGWLAWEEALRALERLAGRLVPEASREYGQAATGVLRRYIELRFEVDAPRLTTREFLDQAGAGNALPDADRQVLGRFLSACDWMKFGRAVATSVELREMHEAAVAFVLASKPVVPGAAAGGALGAGVEASSAHPELR